MLPLRDDNPKNRPAIVMWSLVALNALVFIYSFGLLEQSQTVDLINNYGFVPRLFFEDYLSSFSDLITSMFLHGSLMHILGNMLFLWIFADNIEARMGHTTFIIFYLLGGVFAALCHGIFSTGSHIPMVGASGAISAVLGAYFITFPRHKVQTYIAPVFLIWLPAWLYLGAWIGMQIIEAVTGIVTPGDVSNVAWWAHIGGFLFGVVFARWILHLKDYPKELLKEF